MRLLLALAMCCFSSLMMGQDLEIKTEVSSDSILFGNNILFKISVDRSEAEILNFAFDGFQVLSGPNVSMSMQIINGQSSSSKSFTFLLKPTDLGQYFIEPIEVKNGEQSSFTEPIEVHVYPNPEEVIINPNLDGDNNFGFNLEFPPFFDQLEELEEKKDTLPKRKLKRI